MIAAKISTFHQSKNGSTPPIGGVPVPVAAKRMSVPIRSVERAKSVLRQSPVLAQKVESGTTSVNGAVKQIAAQKAAQEIQRDATGYAIPDKILPLWQRRGEIEEMQKLISKARSAVKAAHEKFPDPLYQTVNLQAIGVSLKNVQRDLDMALPYAVCCTCQGMAADKCASCKGRGFLSKHHYDVAVPVELKAVRSKSCVTK
jgi:hypothetical protein